MTRNLIATLALLLLAAGPAEAQTQFFRVRVDNVSTAPAHFAAGAFAVPEGAEEAAPIGPGGAYTFTVHAAPGAHLSLATMFVQSNDLFYAPDEAGIALFDAAGIPVSGDVTDQLMLWDAGTEVNQEPGEGADQAPRQSAPDTGEAEDGAVRPVDDAYAYPAVEDVVRVTLTPEEGRAFTVRIENVSTETTLTTSTGAMLPVPLSPGVWVVHTDPAPLFTAGHPDPGRGLEAVAEDGTPGALAEALAAESGLTTLLSPGAWAVHTDAGPFFTSGEADRGVGLEAIAEDGNPALLGAALADEMTTTGGTFAVPVGADAPAPVGPGGAYAFTVAARPGAHLSLATMFVQSNDLFYAPDEAGIALFDAAGMPVSGDVTNRLMLWDAGTEVNERPGVGPNQAPRQPAADTGEAEDGAVRPVDDAYAYPDVADAVRVTVTPLEATPFTIRVENVSTGTTLTTSTGAMLPVPLSPGAWAVHAGPAPLFTAGAADRGRGLEAVAEDGMPGMLADALAQKAGLASGAFAVPEGAEEAAPIGPGGAYTFTVHAAPGAHLSLATMFVQSNDLFYAPDEAGIALFDAAGIPVSGDVTDQLMLWDAGTEVNQEPGEGADQAPRQSAPDTGEAEDGAVRPVDDAYAYPAVEDVIRVTVGEVATPVEPVGEAPRAFVLEQNYPNPFNPETTIRFSLQQAGPVSLAVFDLRGRRVATLVQGRRPAGTYEVRWDGTDVAGRHVASGAYLYRLEAGGRQRTRTMILLR